MLNSTFLPQFTKFAPRSRYVLKNKDTNEVLLVVVFTLLHKEDVEKEGAEAKDVGEPDKGSGRTDEGTERSRHEGEKNFEPEADDLD